MVSRTPGERAFDLANQIFLAILSLTFVVPFLVVISTSLVSAAEAGRRGAFILFPESIDPTAYRLLLGRGSRLLRAYQVTLFRVVVGTALNLAFTGSFAFVLSRRALPGRKGLTLMVFFTMLFSGGLIPTFLLVRFLGLYNSVWSLVIPGLINAWWMLIMRNFFYTIPNELEEAATMDGATPLQTLVKVYFPLSLPAFATIGLFYAVHHWNAWFDANIYITDMQKQPIQMILRRVLESSLINLNDTADIDSEEIPPSETMRAAVIVVTTVPILFVYPFIQRFFVKGMLIGSVKG